MRKLDDLTGQRFARLTVIKELEERESSGDVRWLCRCDCGRDVIANSYSLKKGKTKSCGCYSREMAAKRKTTHGLTANGQPRIYRTWTSMKQRCLNPNCKNYPHYGGRGITVCQEWRDDFQAFYNWAMANGYQDDLQIDRIDNDGNYEPGNCRWTECKGNIRNRSNTVRISYQGKNLTIPEWVQITGLPETTIRERYRAGKPPEEILKK